MLQIVWILSYGRTAWTCLELAMAQISQGGAGSAPVLGAFAWCPLYCVCVGTPLPPTMP